MGPNVQEVFELDVSRAFEKSELGGTVTQFMDDRTPAVFVSIHVALSEQSGGVQVYTRELLETLKLAKFDLDIITWEPDQRIVTKVCRKLRRDVYANRLPPELAQHVMEAQRQAAARFVFLNGVDLAPLAEQLRRSGLPADVPIVLFSYGLKSVDYLHAARIRNELGRSSALELGRELIAEMRQRQHLEFVFCLAEFEAEIERWLGAKRVEWLPRTVATDRALDWQPLSNRIGCVSTVDHWPNRDGLVRFMQEFEKIAPADARVRLVGGPNKEAKALEAMFSRLDYVGRLDEEALRAEAATWNCFVHPLFFYACGSSTKLATALAWGIPIVTTPAGRRGYWWKDGSVPVSDTAAGMAQMAVAHLNRDMANRTREFIRRAAETSPSLGFVAARITSALSLDR